MKRALAPWLLPLAMVLGVLVAITNSVVVYGAVLIIAAWVVVPLALAWARKAGMWPRSLGDPSDPNRRRFWGM
jgi:hypothetical protein